MTYQWRPSSAWNSDSVSFSFRSVTSTLASVAFTEPRSEAAQAGLQTVRQQRTDYANHRGEHNYNNGQPNGLFTSWPNDLLHLGAHFAKGANDRIFARLFLFIHFSDRHRRSFILRVRVRVKGDTYCPLTRSQILTAVILTTTPAPTVRPPSRMANRSPSSIATGMINSTPICTLSPGITISIPSGSSIAPVTSVVRM